MVWWLPQSLGGKHKPRGFLWVQLTGCGAQGQDMSYLQPTTKLNDQPRSESVGLFVSSLGTDRHLQRSVLPVDGRNHLCRCYLLSTDFGERKPEASAICWLVDR